MENSDSLFIEIFGIKAAANGQFAIAATVLTIMAAGIGFAFGRKRGMW